jgi:hypothetical protein
MATPSHDGWARGATSKDHTLVVPSRPMGVMHPPASGHSSALVLDDTDSVTHRSRRHRAAHGPSRPVSEDRMSFLASTALAVVSLVFVAAVAVGSMLASTALLRLAYPDRHFDDFRALHEPWVLGVLFGLAVFWLLPPHPWAVEPAVSRPKKRRFVRVKAAA